MVGAVWCGDEQRRFEWLVARTWTGEHDGMEEGGEGHEEASVLGTVGAVGVERHNIVAGTTHLPA